MEGISNILVSNRYFIFTLLCICIAEQNNVVYVKKMIFSEDVNPNSVSEFRQNKGIV